MSFKNNVVVITGGSRGVGKATAILFAKEGAKIVINYRSDSESALKTIKEVEKYSEGMAIKADVGSLKDVKRMFGAVKKKYKRLDVLVNNAGVLINKPFFKRTLADWEKTFRTNVSGVFLCSQEAARMMMKQQAGSIINISSIRGINECGVPDRIDYSASKAAVINFTKTLAKELAPNVRVNAVAPGKIDTEMANYDRKTIPHVIKTIYLKRLIKPEEIANTILFLASEKSSGITGEVITVDGGQSLS